jgi:hypothetical protein
MACLAASPGLGAQDAQPAAGVRRIAIFPYSLREGALRPEHDFARYAIPDILRVAISDAGRFSLVERANIDAALASSALAHPADPDPAELAAIAAGLGADHFIWGYLVSAGEGLRLFQHIAESDSGKILRMEWAALPADQGLFDAAAERAQAFAALIDSELPLRGPDVVYVDRTVVVEKEVPVPAPEPAVADEAAGGEPRALEDKPSGFSIQADFDYRFFFPPFYAWVRPAPRLGVLFSFASSPAGPGLGLALDASPLYQEGDRLFGVTGVTVIQAGFLLDAFWPLDLGPAFSLRLGALGGGQLFAGLVSSQVVAYVRPELGIRADLEWKALPWLRPGIGLRAGIVFNAWGKEPMLEAAPRLFLRFLP